VVKKVRNTKLYQTALTNETGIVTTGLTLFLTRVILDCLPRLNRRNSYGSI